MKKIRKIIKKILTFFNLEEKRQYSIWKSKLEKLGDEKLSLSSKSSASLFSNLNENIIFIHIPKAAGMSVVKSIYGINHSSHHPAENYIKENEVKFKNAFSFAIVRNPYERLYSAYSYLKNGGMNPIDRVWWDLYLSKYESFECFIVKGGLKNAVECNADHFIPQYKFICDQHDNIICDYVCNIDNLSSIEKKLSGKLGRDIIFSHRNKSDKKSSDVEFIYSQRMLEIVNVIYAKDFDILPFEKRYL